MRELVLLMVVGVLMMQVADASTLLRRHYHRVRKPTVKPTVLDVSHSNKRTATVPMWIDNKRTGLDRLREFARQFSNEKDKIIKHSVHFEFEVHGVDAIDRDLNVNPVPFHRIGIPFPTKTVSAKFTLNVMADFSPLTNDVMLDFGSGCMYVVMHVKEKSGSIRSIYASGREPGCDYKLAPMLDLYHRIIAPFFGIRKTGLVDTADWWCEVDDKSDASFELSFWFRLLGRPGLFETKGYEIVTSKECVAADVDAAVARLQCLAADTWLKEQLANAPKEFKELRTRLIPIIDGLPKDPLYKGGAPNGCKGTKSVSQLLNALHSMGNTLTTPEKYGPHCKLLGDLNTFLSTTALKKEYELLVKKCHSLEKYHSDNPDDEVAPR